VGRVPGSATSFRDERLVPGSTHRYRLIATRGSRRSPASSPVVVTLPAPAPTGLAGRDVDQRSATVVWTAPRDVPEPDQYVVLVDGQNRDVVGSSGGPQQSARILGLDPRTTYSVQVQASWHAGGVSPLSDAVPVTTADPPIADARLDGGQGAEVAFRVIASNTTDLKVGSSFTDTWTLTPTCAAGPCDVRLAARFHPSGNGVPFELTLARRGATYTGTTRARISHCDGRPLLDTVTVTVTVLGAEGTGWVATRWAGRIEYRSPYADAGRYYCPSGRTVATISSGGTTGTTT
jgi:hypothetical protein